MAQKHVVELIDDITGETADTTVHFGYQGKQYEIDLAETNAKALDESLQEFIPHARVVSTSKVAKPRSQTDKDTITAIRGWAADTGYTVAGRGRIPRSVVDAYNAAHAH